MVSLIKKWWVDLHLKHICKHCPYDKRHTRDIKHTGKCWWNNQWKKGNIYDVPMWMGIKNYFRLYIFNKPMKICINGKVYEGYKIKKR